MGRGSSKVSGGSGAGMFQKPGFDDSGYAPAQWREKDEAWQKYADSFGAPISQDDMGSLYGYVSNIESMDINRSFYDSTAKPLTDAQKTTVDTLDRLIDSHKTPTDAFYSRFVDEDSVGNLLGMTDAQVNLLAMAARQGKTDIISDFDSALSGSTMFSPSYTSTSATTHSVFEKRLFRREISTPKGTKALAANANETEVIFGRNMNTVLDHISYDANARDGHGQIVLHERFVRYGK